MKFILSFCQMIQNQDGADNIGNPGSNRHTGYAHANADDKYQIQYYIHGTGYDQIIHRSSRISVTPQYGRSEIVN